MTGREGARLAGRVCGRDQGCRAPTGTGNRIPVGRYVPVKGHRGEPGNEGTHGTYKHKDEPHKHPSQPSRATIPTTDPQTSNAHTRTTARRPTSPEPTEPAEPTEPRAVDSEKTTPSEPDPAASTHPVPMRGDGGRTQAEASGGRPRLRRGRPLALRTQLYSVYRPPRWQTVPVQYRYLLVTRYATSIGALRTLV